MFHSIDINYKAHNMTHTSITPFGKTCHSASANNHIDSVSNDSFGAQEMSKRKLQNTNSVSKKRRRSRKEELLNSMNEYQTAFIPMLPVIYENEELA